MNRENRLQTDEDRGARVALMTRAWTMALGAALILGLAACEDSAAPSSTSTPQVQANEQSRSDQGHVEGEEEEIEIALEIQERFGISVSPAGPGPVAVTVDLPGIDPENVTVELHENRLTVSGRRDSEHTQEGKTFHRVERHHGEFRRVVTLPTAVEESKISAAYDKGVLVVTLPKSEKLKPHRVPISVSQ